MSELTNQLRQWATGPMCRNPEHTDMCNTLLKAASEIEMLTFRAGLYDALQVAAEVLPYGYEIAVEIEQGSGVVLLREFDAVDTTLDTGPCDGDESLAECVQRFTEQAQQHCKDSS